MVSSADSENSCVVETLEESTAVVVVVVVVDVVVVAVDDDDNVVGGGDLDVVYGEAAKKRVSVVCERSCTG